MMFRRLARVFFASILVRDLQLSSKFLGFAMLTSIDSERFSGASRLNLEVD
jgi:hypothetical protein